jgi:hypothetical protein
VKFVVRGDRHSRPRRITLERAHGSKSARVSITLPVIGRVVDVSPDLCEKYSEDIDRKIASGELVLANG